MEVNSNNASNFSVPFTGSESNSRSSSSPELTNVLQVIHVPVNWTSSWTPQALIRTSRHSSSLVSPSSSINSNPEGKESVEVSSSTIQLLEYQCEYNCSGYDNSTDTWTIEKETFQFDGDYPSPELSPREPESSLWWNIFNQSEISISYIANSSLMSDGSEQPDLRIHHPMLAVFLGFICLMVVLGNILIMVAIRRERYLHTVTNLFVASLAVADCLVGAVVMPSSVVHEVMNHWWIFGQDWCDLWHSFDVLASTASILNLCVISLDRYWAITDPISYPARMTPRKAKFLIALVWTCSAIISFPAILWWRAVSPPARPLRCDFTEDVSYLVTSSIISFYGPLVVMIFVYFRIYCAAIKQTKSIKTGLKSIPSNDGNNENRVVLRIHRGGGGTDTGTGFGGGHHHRGLTIAEGQPLRPRFNNDISFDESGEFSATGENGLDTKVGSVRHRNMKAFSISRKLAKLAKERKAAKTLGIVMGVFILCWLPFFIANLIKGVCGDDCLLNPDVVYSLVTWLGWLNSGMNFFIYACWSKDFRRAFKKILCSCCNGQSRHGRQPVPSRYSSADLGQHNKNLMSNMRRGNASQSRKDSPKRSSLSTKNSRQIRSKSPKLNATSEEIKIQLER
ncbi:dopamine receptor 2-like [Brevipalpus obovatus]|uniref:dopamine receptor 2-like n=1 Tax=Brevipalpus obovatus TaxID=246614 RepID=UPI003D9DFC31